MIFRILQAGKDKPKMVGIKNVGTFSINETLYDYWVKEINTMEKLREVFSQCNYPELIFFIKPEYFNKVKIDGIIQKNQKNE